jgi:hypothetical protein
VVNCSELLEGKGKMGDESTSNEKEARFWDLYRTYYAFARTFGRLGRWREFF